MKLLITSVLTLMLTMNAHAGSGHSHDKNGGHSQHAHKFIDSKQAISKATAKVKYLANKGTIDKSWLSVKQVSASKKMFNKKLEWVVMFENTKMKDKSKQKLYLFYSLDGHYIAANYSGK